MQILSVMKVFFKRSVLSTDGRKLLKQKKIKHNCKPGRIHSKLNKDLKTKKNILIQRRIYINLIINA